MTFFAVQLICTNLWKIWKARNHCLFCHKAFEPHVVVDEALEYVLEFNEANPDLRSNKSFVQVGDLEPHFHSFNIIYVDVSYFQEEFVSMGCVTKNQSKEVLIAL